MKKWIDFITIPLGLLLYWGMNMLGNKYNIPMFGIAPLQKIILALAEALIILGIAMLLLKIKFPIPFNHIDNELTKDNGWNYLTQRDITIIGFSLLALFFLALVWLTANQ